MSSVAKLLAQSGSRVASTSHSSMTLKEKEDWFRFFTTAEGIDVLPYIYKDPSDAYDKLVKECPDYYLCRNEIATIAQSTAMMTQYLDGVTDVIEIGPGSEYPIERKTLPILRCARDLKHYHAVDYSQNYLRDALRFLKQHISGIQIHGVTADLMNGRISVGQFANGKKCVTFLGSTFCNFNTSQQEHALKQIGTMVDNDDIVILSLDTTQDTTSIIRAYKNEYFYAFMMRALQYFATFNPFFREYIPLFEVQCVWDANRSLINSYFVAKDNLSFTLGDGRKVEILRGQELQGMISRKPTVESVTHLLSENGFRVLDTLSASNAMRMFVCVKS